MPLGASQGHQDGPKMAPRRPKMSPGSCKNELRSPLENVKKPLVFIAFLRSQAPWEGPEATQDGPGRPMGASRWLEDGPRWVQDGPRRPQGGPKIVQDGVQDRPRRSKGGQGEHPRHPGWRQEGSRGPREVPGMPWHHRTSRNLVAARSRQINFPLPGASRWPQGGPKTAEDEPGQLQK